MIYLIEIGTYENKDGVITTRPLSRVYADNYKMAIDKINTNRKALGKGEFTAMKSCNGEIKENESAGKYDICIISEGPSGGWVRYNAEDIIMINKDDAPISSTKRTGGRIVGLIAFVIDIIILSVCIMTAEFTKQNATITTIFAMLICLMSFYAGEMYCAFTDKPYFKKKKEKKNGKN